MFVMLCNAIFTGTFVWNTAINIITSICVFLSSYITCDWTALSCPCLQLDRAHCSMLVFQLWLNRVHSSLSMFCLAVRHCGGGQSCDRAMQCLQKEIVEVRCLHPLRMKQQTSVSTYTTPAVNAKSLWWFSVIVTTPSSFPPPVSMLLTLR